MTSESRRGPSLESVAPEPRARRDRKRRFRRIPPMPVPVRGLWEAASEAERQAAHRTASAVLEAWLGKASRQEIAADLGVSPLRLWQLSQQALAGMLAGLLKQPRRRSAMARQMLPPDEDPVVLRKRIEQLEHDLKLADDVIALLRELPGNKDRERAPTRGERRARKRAVQRATKKARGRRPSGGKKAAPQQPPEGPSPADGVAGSGSGPVAG